jgi:hypothetical protein
MLCFTRPPEPATFAKRVAKSKEAVQRHIEALLSENAGPAAVGLPLTLDAPEPKKLAQKKSDVFQAKWSSFKELFSKAQHGKCAYCEVSVIGAQHGDVDHYYPKGQVQALYDDPQTWGREKPYLSNVEGRSTKPLCKTGYWWLAYEWSNYLLSCMVCNEYWKGAIFPVENDPRKLPPVADVSEAALLLNPFENINPTEHLFFDNFGQVHPAAGSRRGFETIRTCGLDRPSLRNIRGGIAREAYALTDRLRTVDAPSQLRDILYSLYLKGVETNRHPGMVRIIVEQRSGLTWPELVGQFASLLTSELVDATEPDEIRDILWHLYDIGNESCENSELVQTIVAEQCEKRWETLVGELASSFTELFNASHDEGMRISALKFLHEMGNVEHSHSEMVRSLVEHECGLSWEMLEVEIGPGRPTYQDFKKT